MFSEARGVAGDVHTDSRTVDTLLDHYYGWTGRDDRLSVLDESCRRLGNARSFADIERSPAW